MNGFHYVMGGIYCAPCEFASIEAFGRFVEPRFADLPFQREPVLRRLHTLITELENTDGGTPADVVDEVTARNLLIARDLRRVAAALEGQPMRDPHASLPVHRARYEAVLRTLGLDFPSPKLFIVDAFPKPYDTMDWTATSPDLADQRSYGIEPGTYFKRRYLIPYRSDILLAHEMMHQIISHPDPDWLGRGLEEGIAVAVGELYVGARIVGADLAFRYARYHWLDSQASPVNRLYADYTRMAAAIYHSCGLAGLLALVTGGRERIKEAERACLAGSFDDLDLPTGRWDDGYSALLRRFAMTTAPNLVVSPLAKYVADYARAGRTVTEISVAARVPADLVTRALGELQEQVFLVVVDDGTVDYSDVGVVESAGCPRYDL